MSDLEERKLRVESELKEARGQLRQTVQDVQSRSRVLTNMVGMMELMNHRRGRDQGNERNHI